MLLRSPQRSYAAHIVGVLGISPILEVGDEIAQAPEGAKVASDKTRLQGTAPLSGGGQRHTRADRGAECALNRISGPTNASQTRDRRDYSGLWQTASMLFPSGSNTYAP